MTDPRADWLVLRREHVTASDVPAILGVDPHRGAFEVWAEKVGALEAEEILAMRRGRRHEAPIADEYAEETGRPVRHLGDFELQRHPAIPWLAATLDRVTEATIARPAPAGCAGAGPLQIKMAIGSAREWEDEPPLRFQIQVQIEIACYGAAWGSLAGLLGPQPLHVTDWPRHEAFLAAALPRLEEFRQRVIDRHPPEADGSPGTTEAVKRLWGTRGDGSTVALDHDALSLANELDHAKAKADEWSLAAQRLKNQLRARIGAATFGALPDGSFLTLKTTAREAYEVAATEYRALRRWWPKRRLRRR